MNNAKVLIVDDEDSIRRFLCVTLASQAYTVYEAASGKEALSRAALRRIAKASGDPIFISGSLKVDLSRRLVTVAEHEVSLTPNEYGLLRVLVNHAGKVLTHHYLLREVWGAEYGDELHMLHVNISNLRRKIEPTPARPQLIITEPGVGYRLMISE